MRFEIEYLKEQDQYFNALLTPPSRPRKGVYRREGRSPVARETTLR